MSSLRFDRAATRFLFGPARRYLVRDQRQRIPILMYHRICSVPEPGVHPYFRVNTSKEVFEAQLRFLKTNGYSTVSLDQATALLSRSRQDGCKHVVITFDDGYQDFYTDAFPLLEKYGFTATVFLPTGYIGDQRRTFKDVDCLTWPEVRRLHAKGVIFGGHTISHPQLASLNRKQIRTELLESKAQIEDQLGQPVRSFSYPFQFPETDLKLTSFIQEMLENAGYANGVSTIVGTATGADNPFFLKRLPVNNDDDTYLFKWKLEGGYDWVHAPQYWFKRIKKLRSRPSIPTRTDVQPRETNAAL